MQQARTHSNKLRTTPGKSNPLKKGLNTLNSINKLLIKNVKSKQAIIKTSIKTTLKAKSQARKNKIRDMSISTQSYKRSQLYYKKFKNHEFQHHKQQKEIKKRVLEKKKQRLYSKSREVD